MLQISLKFDTVLQNPIMKLLKLRKIHCNMTLQSLSEIKDHLY